MNTFRDNDYYCLPSSQLFPLAETVQGEVRTDSRALEIAWQALQQYRAGDLTAALRSYSDAIEHFPQQPFFYACRALINRAMGDDEGSYYDYQAAKSMDFNYHHFLEWKYNEGAMVEAEELLELEQQTDATEIDHQWYVNRAMLRVQHYYYREAVADFAEAFALYPNGEYLISAAAVNMRMLRYDVALQQLNAAIESDADLVDAYLYRGKLYAAIREQILAEKDFDTCVARQADNKLYFEERAGFYEQNERLTDAIADYSRLIDLEPEDFFPYVLRADLYERSDRPDLAIGDYDRAIALNPYYSDLYQYRADLREKTGDHTGAEADRARCRELEDEE